MPVKPICEFSSPNRQFPLESAWPCERLRKGHSSRSGHENCASGKISKGSCDRRWRHERQAARNWAKGAAKISIWPYDDAAQDGEPGEEVRGRLEIQLHFAGLSGAYHQWASPA